MLRVYDLSGVVVQITLSTENVEEHFLDYYHALVVFFVLNELLLYVFCIVEVFGKEN